MSSYRILIDLTSKSLVKRTKCYKALVIVFSIIGVTSLISAIATLSFSPFIGLLLQIPAYSFYLVCDNKKLDQWRSQILETWQSKAIDISALNQALSANKTIPPLTLQGMLKTLPELDDLVEEQAISQTTRQAISTAVLARDKLFYYKLICRSILSAILVIAIVTAVLLGLWLPLLAFLIAPVLLIICAGLNRKLISKVKTSINDYAKKTDFDSDKYNEVLKPMDWYGISSDSKEQILLSMT